MMTCSSQGNTYTSDNVSLRDIQRGLEEHMLSSSRDNMLKYIKTNEKNSTNMATRPGFRLIQNNMELAKAAVQELFDANEGKKGGVGGRPNPHIKALVNTGLSVEIIAFITLTSVIGGVLLFGGGHQKEVKACSRTRLARLVGTRIHDEWRAREFGNTEKRKALLAKLELDFKARGYPSSYRKRTIKNYYDAEMLTWKRWEDRGLLSIGIMLVEKLVSVMDGFKLEVIIGGKEKYLVPNDEAFKELDKLLDNSAGLYQIYRPMVTRPRPWSQHNLFEGGYLHRGTPRYPLIKGTGKRDVDRMNQHDMSKVIAAVNAIQNTAWRINHTMVDVCSWAYHVHGEDIGKLSCNVLTPLPPTPPNYETDEAVKKAHNKACFLVHNENRMKKTMRIHTSLAINTANQYKGFNRIYFPHNCDSRGRVYPLPGLLNPQSVDYSKAMLEFADGQPILCDDDAAWIAVACANAYGYDKVSLQERVDWVFDNEEMVLSVAADWKSDLRWTHASEPFMFLRSCLEWAGLKQHGFGYVSHLPIHLDATASGLQHFAAMRRSEQGRSVNLVPNLPRQDVYGDVAKKVIAKLEAMGTTEAQQLMSLGIDRKTTKRQVMTVPYNAKMTSCLTYTREWLKDKGEEKPFPWTSEEHSDRVVLLGRAIWEAIGETVTDAKATMSWISSLAGAYGKEANARVDLVDREKSMCWTTPDGFPVEHFVEKEREVIIDLLISGERMQARIHQGQHKVDVSGSSLAVAPNFVHSLDACHCRMAALALRDMYPTSHAIAVIHDSFGTHASRTRAFVEQCIRPTFVQMYEEHDVLAELATSVSPLVADKDLLVPPAKGTLDLRGVLESEFFFS